MKTLKASFIFTILFNTTFAQINTDKAQFAVPIEMLFNFGVLKIMQMQILLVVIMLEEVEHFLL